MYLDLVIKEVTENQSLTNVLAYADDIAQLAKSEEDLQDRLTSWYKCFKKHGLKLNLDKTEIVMLSRSKITTNISLEEKRIKQVSTFKYLGSILSENGLIDLEINERIKKIFTKLGAPLQATQRQTSTSKS
jgi:hypothetical protein